MRCDSNFTSLSRSICTRVESGVDQWRTSVTRGGLGLVSAGSLPSTFSGFAEPASFLFSADSALAGCLESFASFSSWDLMAACRTGSAIAWRASSARW